MATYLILNCIFLATALCVFYVRGWFFINRSMVVVLALLLATTAIFDSLIVGAQIVAYDAGKILGVYVGKAPVEDFFYALLAAILIPVVWNVLGKKIHGNS